MRLLYIFLVLFALCPTAAAQAPVVDKIEPPNWWVGMQWAPVQLMLYGDHLDGITARFAEPGPAIRAVHTLPNASYAFLDVDVPADLPPGTYTLEITRGDARTTVPYAFEARAPRVGRHQGFGSDDVVYLVTPDRFANGDPSNDRAEGVLDEYDPSQPGLRHGGDLQGLIERLDYLQDLGVTALWLNPVLENSGRNSYHGYAATDLYRIDPRFGTNADYARFVDEAHRRGLKVIFDHVNNHIGIRHPWIDDLPTATWLNGSVEEHLNDKHYKLALTDPHADPASAELLQTFWFVDAMPDLNQRDPFLAAYLIQNTIWWMERTGLDGIREDTYPYPDQAYLADWAAAILAEYPTSNIVGEIWEGVPAYLALFQDGSPLPGALDTNLPTVMDFALTDAWRAYLAGEGTLREIYNVIAQDFLYADPSRLLTFFDNHDMTRGIYVADGDVRRLKQVLAMLLTTRGIPQLLYGTEINMRGGASHIELRADMPGGFPGDPRDAFTRAGRTTEENEVFDYLRTLLQLRQEHPALRRGALVHYPPTYANDVYRYVRTTPEETILVVVNGHADRRAVDLSELSGWLPPGTEATDLLLDRRFPLSMADSLSVDGHGVRVLRLTAPAD